MPPRIYPTGSLVFAVILAGAFLPGAAFAQAGLSGNPFSGQTAERTSKFDTGFKSKSALGQLEELTGSKVDRSTNNANQAALVAQQSRAIKPHFDPNQAFRNELAGAVAGMLIDAIFSDNSAQQKAAAEAAAAQAAAQAAAEAEAFRVQQELARLARIRMAQRYRAEWDARETEIGGRLGGAFTVTTGTAFFGRPANPDADTVAAILGQDIDGAEQTSGEVPDVSDSDTSVVDLRDSSLVVPLSRPPAYAGLNSRSPTSASRWTYEMTANMEPPASPSSTKQLNALIAYFGPWLGKWYWETVIQGAAKSTAWGRLKGIPGMGYVNAVVGADEQRESGTEELSGAYTELSDSGFSYASNTAAILANPYSNGGAFIESTSGSLEYQVSKLKVKISEMLFKGFSDRSEMPDLEELRAPVGEGNVVPIYGRGAHPDQFRINNVLFGRP